MSDFHKSKEVYRYTPTANGDKLVPVRGLYVSGLHKEPWYIDHAVTVNNFTSNDGTIVHYTQLNKSIYDDSALAFTGLTIGDVSFVNYYQANALMYDDSALAFTGFDISLPEMTSYETSNVSVYDDSVLSFTALSVDASLTSETYKIIRSPQNPQPTITLRQFTSTDSTISGN